MNEIKCPQCGKVFSIDETSYASIVQQVRDSEFNKRVKAEKDAAVKLANALKDKELEVVYARLQEQRETALAEKEQQILQLQNQIAQASAEKETAIQKAIAEQMQIRHQKDQEILQLQSQISQASTEKEAAVQRAIHDQEQTQHEKDQEILELKNQIAQAAIEKEAAIQRTVTEQTQKQFEKDQLIAQLQNRIAQMDSEFKLAQKELESQQALVIQQKDDEIAYYKDLKARQSTKMVGETLEQHCEIEFNRLRTVAFPNAHFDKDNDASGGSKGDYIFRDFVGDEEYISIMFEMKTELDETATKHKNEDFLKKLDKDRNEKGCEYAVLVSLLEADNEFYNTGIVDMSYKYKKMYVIRPQFFIPMISILKNAAGHSLEYRRQLKIAKSQDVDLSKFTNQLMDFKTRFSESYRLASDRFDDAIKEIDNSIKHMEKIKEALRLSAEHLRRANTKADDLSIKKLTSESPTLVKRFEEAGIPVE